MELTFAQVENGIVVNIVEATQEWIDEQPGTWIEYDDSCPCGIGYTVTDGKCVLPPKPYIPLSE